MRTRSAYRVVSEGDGSNTSSTGNMIGLGDKGRAEVKRKNIGHWNPFEQATYYIFLTNHQENFVKKELRRTDKIFKEMSKFVKTRCPDQCRSHHQKMENKFPEFDDILNSLRLNCSPSIVTELLTKFQEQNKCMSPEITQEEIPEEQIDLSVKGTLGEVVEEPEHRHPSEVYSTASDEIPLLTFDEIIELEQAIKPTPLLADYLFSLGEPILL